MAANPSLSAAFVSGAAAAPAIACAHCQLPVPAGLIEAAAEHQFCCHGCRTVYAMIHDAGLDRFYAIRATEDAQPARVSDRRFHEFDDPAFLAAFARPLPQGLQQMELQLEGVHCAACVWLVEKLPRLCPGVIDARVQLRDATATVTWDAKTSPLSAIAAALNRLGYTPYPARQAEARVVRQRADRRFLIRIAVAGALAGNVMLLAFALYSGDADGIDAQYRTLFRGLSCGLGLLSVAWPGALFLRGGWAALRTRTAHLDLPIALGILVGALAGTVNTLRGAGEIYFDSITVLIFLLLVGRWIQQRQQRWAANAVELLFNLTPSVARRVESDEVREVAVLSVKPGDLVEVRAGDTVPVDGVVEAGRSDLDHKLLTGESHPRSATVGTALHAGAMNLSAPLHVRVTAAGQDTRIAKLMRLVEECSRTKAPIIQLADRIAGWFVVVVIALAVLTLGLWWRTSPHAAIEHAIGLLIVTCPCALGLATPLALTAAIGRAARRGILIKNGGALELLARRGRLILDKTGTVTAGRLSLEVWHGDRATLLLAAALERCSAHPLARALRASLGETERTAADALPVADVQETTGRGIRGFVDGAAIVVGSAKFMAECGVPISTALDSPWQALRDSSRTPVFVAVRGVAVGVAGFGDPIAPDAPAALEALRHDGWEIELLSGDDPQIVAQVAAALAIETAAGAATPEEKLTRIRAAQAAARVVMVGDGVNDAAALAAADVGVAVKGGAEASLAAADIYLQQPGLVPLAELVRGARRTMSSIRAALIVSLAYNAFAATLAIAGCIHPVVAAILMPISSLSVVALAFRTRTFGAKPCR